MKGQAMIDEHLKAARAVSALMGTRIQIVIPSILAEGETFDARISITGADALPVCAMGCKLHFEGCLGIEGLPQTLELDPNSSTAVISHLTAMGSSPVALVRARIEQQSAQGRVAGVSSNPAWIFKEPPYRLFWGDLHVHTNYSNCHAWRCLDPEWCYDYAQNISLLDFVAAADHLRGIAADTQRWPRLQALAKRYNIPGRFVTFPGFESSHAQGYGGDNNAYYLDDDAPYFWLEREDMHGAAPAVHLRELWEQLDRNRKPYFTIPHHTGRARKYRAWDEDYYNPDREPLFEIYSSWGSSEMRHTRLPISGGNNDAPSYFVDALKAGTRFGVIASSDDHATLPGSVHHFRTEPYCNPSLNGYSHKGLAAVRAPELTRGALFGAMQKRSTYATTHARSLVDMTVGDGTMGQEMPSGQRLDKTRKITVRFTLEGSASAKVTLMRNGVEFDTRSLRGSEIMTSVNNVVFEDAQDINKVALCGTKFHPEPFLVYYARIEDRNGEHQWTSPLWIDLI